MIVSCDNLICLFEYLQPGSATPLNSCISYHVRTMASGGTEKDWQQIEEEITCSISGDPFIDPKTMSCLHMFCN